MSAHYRPEIDGLRSVAVLPVLLFHAGIGAVPGGFVGVDIFFVISGYLIASIILREQRASEFSLAGFYERRVRRILPALALVILFSIVASYVFALPDQLVNASASGIAALFGVSNIYFWTQTGYFAPVSDYQMLLHTWSLGVEEQFYLLLPAFLIVLARTKFNLAFVMAIGLVPLFVLGLFLSWDRPSVAFFLLPARAWELALGVALAAGVIPTIENKMARSLIAAVGLMAMVMAFLVIDERMAFPGWVALLPCLGAAAVILAASGENWVGKLLRLPVLRFIGLISYSLYLWHWPVFVALRMYQAQPQLSAEAIAAGLALSFVLATLSWKFVEQPFRSRSATSFKAVLIFVGVTSIAAIGLALSALATAGHPARLSPQAQQYAAAANDRNMSARYCLEVQEIPDQNCTIGTPDRQISFAVIGDSPAPAIEPAIERWANSNGRSGTMFWRGGCLMLFGVSKAFDPKFVECAVLQRSALDAIINDDQIDIVFVVGRWEAYYTGLVPEIGEALRFELIDDHTIIPTPENTKRVFERGVLQTSKILGAAGKRVVFIGAVPEVGFNVPTAMALAAHNQNVTGSKRVDRDNQAALALDSIFGRIAAASDTTSYISTWRQFCSEQCLVLNDDAPIFSDEDHLTATAAREFVGPFLEAELHKQDIR